MLINGFLKLFKLSDNRGYEFITASKLIDRQDLLPNVRNSKMIGTEQPQQIDLQPGQRFFCTWPWETVTLMSDGTIVCGCADPFKKRPAGNAAILNDQRNLEWTGVSWIA